MYDALGEIKAKTEALLTLIKPASSLLFLLLSSSH